MLPHKHMYIENQHRLVRMQIPIVESHWLETGTQFAFSLRTRQICSHDTKGEELLQLRRILIRNGYPHSNHILVYRTIINITSILNCLLLILLTSFLSADSVWRLVPRSVLITTELMVVNGKMRSTSFNARENLQVVCNNTSCRFR